MLLNRHDIWRGETFNKVINMKKLKSAAYEHIKNRILNDKYKAKQLISEKEISVELSMSKTPVKEALHHLEDENFVVISPRKSVVVTEVDLKLIKDVFQVRTKIEPLLVELTISFMDRDELKTSLISFRNRFERLSGKEKVTGDEFDNLYDSYRYFFAENCGNFFFAKQMRLVYDHLHRIRKVLYGKNNRRLEALEEHIEIINLILEDAPVDNIRNLCKKHIEAAQIDFFKNLNNLNI